MRRFGCLVIVLGGLAAGLFFADQAITRYAEQRTEERVQRTLEADRTDVDLRGWPVSVRVLLGTIPTVHVRANGVPLDNGATLDRLDVDLTDVEVNVADLRANRDRLPPAEEGTFTARLNEASVAGMMGLPAGIAEVELVDGVVRLSAAGLQLDAEVVAEGGDVVVRLQGPLAQLLGGAEFPIDLSDAPGAPAVTEVQIRRGVMIVRGTLEDVQR